MIGTVQHTEYDALGYTIRVPWLALEVETIPRPPKEVQGVFSFTIRAGDIGPAAQQIATWLCRCPDRIGLKVFKKQVDDLAAMTWGNMPRSKEVPLVEASIIQNLFALDNVAPRVYGIVRLNDHWAQVTDWAHDLPPVEGSIKTRIAESKGRFKVKVDFDANPKNVINGRWLDFQVAHFVGFEALKEDIIERAYRKCAWGSRREIYQDIPEWGIEGQRTLSQRLRETGLGSMDLGGHVALDVGCNVGTMSRALADLGAARVVGLDTPVCSRVAAELSILFGYWNLDFLGGNWKSQFFDPLSLGLMGFDLVLFLSNFQLGFPEWAHAFCEDLLIAEGHCGRPSVQELRDMLEPHFTKVEYKGKTRDHGPRPLFYCHKGEA